MRSFSILGIISVLFLCLTTILSQELSWSRQGCPDKCGNVIIPFPFGIGPGCSSNSSFAVTCNTSTNPPKPFLSSISREVVNISIEGVVYVNEPVSPMSCSGAEIRRLSISLQGSPFTVSSRYNSFAVLGCTNSATLLANDGTKAAGCLAICETNTSSTNSSCSGLNCCEATIPPRLKSLEYTYQSIHSSNGSVCGYALPVEKEWFQRDYKNYSGLQMNQSYPYDQEFVSAPLVLEWELDNSEIINHDMCRYDDVNAFLPPSQNYSGSSWCSCRGGAEGNPYLPGGCTDINECTLNSIKNPCPQGMICINLERGSFCDYPKGYNRISPANIAFISIGSVVGAMILLLVAWRCVKAIRKRIEAKRRQQFFKRNGGLLLLSSTDNSIEKAKLFTYKELARATDNYSEDRILGRGGQGTVYKGMLRDGRILAIKKSKKVEEGDVQDFINEVVILSQINHRNVVKLLGCCLEAEVPLLVYEFIPNGTLFQHIHEPSEDFPLTWEIRLRIAREVAGALAYLHSAASVPIYHRDIKSTNILLDDKYRARISDFGASRTIAIDQTHLTTRVLGTFGYLDPEYFQSSQFTEKSDVYSFGVVMVELLTGEKAISSIRAEVGRSLATIFLQTMEEDRVYDILDERVVREGKREEVMGVARLARRCLHLNGKRRPTMKEVAMELERIQLKEDVMNENAICSKEGEAVEADESYGCFSSITKSMNFDHISITPCSDSYQDHLPLLDS